MNNLLPLVVLILLSIIYVSLQGDNNKIFLMLTLIVAVLYLCYIDTKEKFSNYAPINYKMGKCSNLKLNKDVTNLMKYNDLLLQSEDTEKPLVSDVTIFTTTGDGIKLRDDVDSFRHPHVDGTENTPQKMFMFAHNQSSPDCCPSVYSTDRGCVCMTENQKKFLRGELKPDVAQGDCRLSGKY